MKITLPTTIIYINSERNHHFFAKIEWELYKCFGKKRTIPCGRTKKDKHLNCYQPLDEEHVYLNEDKTEAYCKCCGHIKMMSNHQIDLKNPYNF